MQRLSHMRKYNDATLLSIDMLYVCIAKHGTIHIDFYITNIPWVHRGVNVCAFVYVCERVGACTWWDRNPGIINSLTRSSEHIPLQIAYA